ncbi:MAG TPA: hypothetical protein VK927_00080, partial [Adhaeribacter sp.]|nr:hypothetical protein [Adhaeribacter sp.]
MDRFSGRNILVIGGTKGIGLALTKKLVAESATVWVAARNQPAESGNIQFISWDALQNDTTALLTVPEVLHGLVYCPGSIN